MWKRLRSLFCKIDLKVWIVGYFFPITPSKAYSLFSCSQVAKTLILQDSQYVIFNFTSSLEDFRALTASSHCCRQILKCSRGFCSISQHQHTPFGSHKHTPMLMKQWRQKKKLEWTKDVHVTVFKEPRQPFTAAVTFSWGRRLSSCKPPRGTLWRCGPCSDRSGNILLSRHRLS